MCAIAGIWNYNDKLELKQLSAFTDSMSHRGPDGAGHELLTDNLGFGHRRLSILDLTENGKQPMKYADGRYTITYNGEVYNFIELKKELENFGYNFKTDTDTEIILAAYHKWGRQALLKFNGMFAFAIWDSLENVLFLARDRFGVKPLHYFFISGKFFAFASETIAFKHLQSISRKIDFNNFTRAIINNQKIEGCGYTIYESIYQVLPGHCIVLKQNETPKQERWWNTFKHIPTVPEKYNDQVDTFKELFADACKIRMRSDVPIASALSGGVDSSSVYCMTRQVMSKAGNIDRAPQNWQKAFVATFPGSANDEKIFAEEVVNYVNGTVEYIKPDYSNLINEIITSTLLFDGICGTPINVAGTIYKAMRNNNTIVSLDGHGGDEILYGYAPSVFEAYIQESLAGNEQYANELLDIYVNMHPIEQQKKIKEKVISNFQSIKKIEEKFNKEPTFIKSVKKQVKKTFLKNVAIPKEKASSWFNDLKLNPLDFLTEQPYSFSNLSRAETKLAYDFHIHPLPANLRNFDRAAMQYGVEIRMPFLDWRLVTYSFALPFTSKLGTGYTKKILRDSMKGLMPENIRTRTAKVGLSAPLADWFNNPLKQFLLDEINSNTFKKSIYWNGNEIANYVQEQFKNDSWNKKNTGQIWNIINAHILLTHK